MRYRGKGLAAAACALSLAMVPANAFASSFSSQYDQIQRVVTGGNSNSGSNTGNNRTTSQTSGNNVTRTGTSAGGNSGPGAGQNNSGNNGLVSDLDKSADALPTVKEVSLSEQYYSDYEMYEESIDGQYFFYSNTGNGSITDKSVYIDIPSNLEYTVELDGNPITYQSNALLSAKGTYVFRFHAVTGSNALAGQTDYSATFRFRIQDKPPQKAGESSENGIGSSGGSGSLGGSENSRSADKQAMVEALQSGRVTASELADALGISVSDLPSYLGLGDVNSITDTYGNVIGGVTGSDSTGESSENRSDILAGLLGSDETEGESESATEEDQTDNVDPQEAVKEAIAQAAAKKGGRGNGDGLAETWDAVTGFYAETLFTGTEFDANVQNGATVNGSVYFRFPEENTLVPILTKNGEEVEYTPGDEITEDGWYCLKLTDTVPEYETVYKGMEEPRFYFQIINQPVNDLQLLFVPKGENIVSLEKDGNYAVASAAYAKFDEDGQYTLTYTTKSGTDEVISITKDTTPPDVLVVLSSGKAEVQIQEENVTATLYKDGEEVEYTDAITEPGSYELHVKDEAGNESVDTFKIQFRLSMATVIAVMLIIAIVAGIVVFVIRVRKHTSIRE